MTKNVENRSRVQAGIQTGGQFAPEAHAEPAGVTLTQAPPAELDQKVIAALGDVVRTNASVELGRWQRRMDKGRRGYEHEPQEPMPAKLADAVNQAKDFESLQRDEQEKLMDALGLSEAKHMLEPGQKLGTDRIKVAEGLSLEDGNIAMTLAAQAQVHEAGIAGTVTLTGIGDVTTFEVEDGNAKHTLRVGSGLLSLAAEPADEDDYSRGDWLSRADIGVYGGSAFDKGRAAELGAHYSRFREYAMMMDVVASSPFREHEGEFGELDRGARTADLKADGVEYRLDVSGEEPSLSLDNGQALHPSMVRGFLNHMATRTGHPDGEALASDLREVFRETDRRLIP
jgi:hypothetical protein